MIERTINVVAEPDSAGRGPELAIEPEMGPATAREFCRWCQRSGSPATDYACLMTREEPHGEVSYYDHAGQAAALQARICHNARVNGDEGTMHYDGDILIFESDE